jgi:hypothetical protein
MPSETIGNIATSSGDTERLAAPIADMNAGTFPDGRDPDEIPQP